MNAALEAFWRRGFEATSLSDLCDATGLHKGSLYQAFGDKHQLFMRALASYAEQQARELAAAASESDSALGNFRAMLRYLAGRAGHEKGCLLINALVELAPHDPEVKATLKQFSERQAHLLAELIGKAQAAGEIRADLVPSRVARQLMVLFAGAAATSKGMLNLDELREVFEDTIASWK